MSSDLKVINLGLPKSGTTTFGKALSEAGLRVADWRIRRGDANATAFGFVGNLMYHGYFAQGDPLALMANYDAFAEIDIVRHGLNLWPQTDWGLLSAIQENYPGAKFVLTHRDPAKISDSMLRWSNMGRTRLPENEIPGLPRAFDETDQQRIRWIEGHHKFCRQVFKNNADFHVCHVEDPDAQDLLADFLGIALPWWGIANANTRREAEMASNDIKIPKSAGIANAQSKSDGQNP